MCEALECCCGEPQTPGVIHRTEAPCFVIQDDTALLKQALEMMEDNHHLVADNEKHAYVMQHLAVIEALRERLK